MEKKGRKKDAIGGMTRLQIENNIVSVNHPHEDNCKAKGQQINWMVENRERDQDCYRNRSVLISIY
jgi:hypothetical protein